MNPRELIVPILAGLLAWLGLSCLVLYFGEWLVKGLFPLFRAVIRMISPEISPSLKLIKSVKSQFDDSIELSAWVLRPIYLNADKYIPPGADLKSSAHLLIFLVPLVIEWSIVSVRPVRRWSQRLLLIASGLLTGILLLMAIVPALLLSNLEMFFQNVALTGKIPRSVPWFLDWMMFFEMGGHWLLGIVPAWLCILLQRGLLRD